MSNDLNGLSLNLKKTPGEKLGFEKLSPEETKELVSNEDVISVDNITKIDTEAPQKHKSHYTKKRVSVAKKKKIKKIAKASKRKNRKRK